MLKNIQGTLYLGLIIFFSYLSMAEKSFAACTPTSGLGCSISGDSSTITLGEGRLEENGGFAYQVRFQTYTTQKIDNIFERISSQLTMQNTKQNKDMNDLVNNAAIRSSNLENQISRDNLRDMIRQIVREELSK